ncbi:hypothetical protein [Pararhodonellum marinum]|uniref:hypothetical protein n=1 Tax=Pararhodonellum marinum TaxID=2755358 RepID=UPI00188EF30D|nr:hypothetical protein [Pararhodonellum marinum]
MLKARTSKVKARRAQSLKLKVGKIGHEKDLRHLENCLPFTVTLSGAKPACRSQESTKFRRDACPNVQAGFGRLNE